MDHTSALVTLLEQGSDGEIAQVFLDLIEAHGS